MSIKENYQNILETLPQGVTLVAVSKMHPVEMIREVYDLGQRIFGENKVQELVKKQPHLPADIQWHLIGHLQRNKVRFIAEFVDTIESVDSEPLLEEINKRAGVHQRKIKVYLQVKIGTEETKSGLTVSDARSLFERYSDCFFPNVELMGLMGIATNTDDQQQIKSEFLSLKKLFDYFSAMTPLSSLSMGMSGDYKLAIACGSNCVRIGSGIFGARDYNQK